MKLVCLQLLSEYVGGGTLFTWLQRQVPMPLDMLRYCTRETLDGLAYLHSNAVVHEDLRVTLQFFFRIFVFVIFIVIVVKCKKVKSFLGHVGP